MGPPWVLVVNDRVSHLKMTNIQSKKLKRYPKCCQMAIYKSNVGVTVTFNGTNGSKLTTSLTTLFFHWTYTRHTQSELVPIFPSHSSRSHAQPLISSGLSSVSSLPSMFSHFPPKRNHLFTPLPNQQSSCIIWATTNARNKEPSHALLPPPESRVEWQRVKPLWGISEVNRKTQ